MEIKPLLLLLDVYRAVYKNYNGSSSCMSERKKNLVCELGETESILCPRGPGSPYIGCPGYMVGYKE